MSVSSHRKLNVEQLINLAQVYWDDPTKLMEIRDATEGRVDAVAQLLFGAVSNRLDRLQRDPARTLAEPTPDLAALITERLGQKPGGSFKADTEPREGEDKKSRRLMPLVLAGLLLFLAAGAWFLWPQAKEEQKTAAVGKPGIEIFEPGEIPEDAARRGAGSSGLTGRRQPEFGRRLVDPEDEDTTKPLPAGRLPAQPRSAEVDEPKEAPVGRTPATRTSTTPAERSTAARSAAQPGATSSRSASGATPAVARVPPSAGIAIAEAQLECYLSDSRPTSCSALPAGGRSPAASAGSGGGGGSPPAASPAGAQTPSQGGGAPGGSPSRSSSPSQGARSESSASGAGSGGGSRSGGGGGAGGDTPSSASPSSSAARPPSQPASAGGGGAGGASSPQQPQQQAMTPPVAAPDPDCPTEAQPGRVVFIFDGSVSMGLPLGLDPAVEDELDEGTRRKDPDARARYRALLQQPGPKRMGRAQLAFSEATEDLPDHVELGLIVFQECRDIRQVGVFGAGRRGPALDYVRGMIPRGRTPLAQSLMVAQEMLDTAKGSIVLLTDGREFCNGDPCAVAQHLKATRPDVPVHIVDITGQASAECVAEITGGRSYAPSETDDLSRVLRAAFRGAAPHCPDTR